MLFLGLIKSDHQKANAWANVALFMCNTSCIMQQSPVLRFVTNTSDLKNDNSRNTLFFGDLCPFVYSVLCYTNILTVTIMSRFIVQEYIVTLRRLFPLRENLKEMSYIIVYQRLKPNLLIICNSIIFFTVSILCLLHTSFPFY